MQKKLIAVAVAGALVAPAALAEVTISGGLQAEVVSVGGDGVVPTGLYAMDGMSRAGQNKGGYGFLKFAAAEDLGGGMKALASYNMQIAVDNVLATRDAFVGLAGNFGTVLAGRLSTPYKTATAAWDPFYTTVHQARGGLGMSSLNGGYVDNAIAYANSFSGVKVVAAVVLDESQDTTDATKTSGKNATSFSVNAPVGPVELAVGYANLSEFGGVSTTPKNYTGTKVGVKWKGGPVTLAGQVEMLGKGVTASGKKGNIIWVNGAYALSDATSLTASYGSADKKVNDAAESKAGTYVAVGAFHALTNTTRTWVAYSSSDNGLTGGKLTAVSAGMRVNF